MKTKKQTNELKKNKLLLSLTWWENIKLNLYFFL